jgi:hypothetical protein
VLASDDAKKRADGGGNFQKVRPSAATEMRGDELRGCQKGGTKQFKSQPRDNVQERAHLGRYAVQAVRQTGNCEGDDDGRGD